MTTDADPSGAESAEEHEPPAPLPPVVPRDGVPDVLTDAYALARYAERVAAGHGPVALDAERASGYRYSQRAYLVQVRREGAGSALIDPIALPDLSFLNDAIGETEWILHAATQDLACLADVGLRPRALFDTELAGRLLGRERVSLAALVASELGLGLEKGHGATDWSLRPLSAAQLRYAVLDVEPLPALRDVIARGLAAQGKDEFARQEFHALLTFAPRDRGDEGWRRLSGIHRVRKPRNLAVARELWLERDAIARDRDVAVGRLLPDASIVVVATTVPETLDALLATKEFHGRGAHRYARHWWQAIERALAMSTDALPATHPPPSGPPPPRTWADRQPQAFARWEAARTVMAELSEAHAIPAENLLTPELLRRLAWQPPDPLHPALLAAALRDAGARPWQTDLVVPPLAAAWARAGSA